MEHRKLIFNSIFLYPNICKPWNDLSLLTRNTSGDLTKLGPRDTALLTMDLQAFEPFCEITTNFPRL